MKWSVVKWCPLPRDGVVGWFKLAALPLRSSAGVWLPVEPSGVETAEAHDPRRLFKEGRWKEDILIKAIKCDRVFRRFLRKRYTGEGRKAKKRRRKEETGKRRKSNEILRWRLCRQGFLLSLLYPPERPTTYYFQSEYLPLVVLVVLGLRPFTFFRNFRFYFLTYTFITVNHIISICYCIDS